MFRAPLSVFSLMMCLVLIPERADAQFGNLTLRVPNDANAIAIFNVDKILSSPMAKDGNWREQREKAAAAGITIVPASASHFVLAANMDFERMSPNWEVAVADVNYPISIPQIAARRGGTIDSVAGLSAAVVNDDSYVVSFGKASVGAMRPANRQSVAKWIRETNTTRGNSLSKYLKEAVAYADKLGTPIVYAMDLHDVVSPEELKKRLSKFESISGKKIDVDEVSKVLSSIRGITLGLTVKDHVSGAMIIDFNEDAGPLKGIAKPILLEALSNHGSMIAEFNDWKEVVKGKRVSVGGRLYESGLRRIFSILDAPAALHTVDPNSDDPADKESLVILSSQQYFKSVTSMIDDLEASHAKTQGQQGNWWGRYAKKIDSLPLVNVDKDMIEYGGFVSSSLREGETVLRAVGGKTRVRELNSTSGGLYREGYRGGNYYGYYGTYYAGMGQVRADARAVAQDRARIRSEERISGASSARDIMTDINAATGEVRRRMAEKYSVDF